MRRFAPELLALASSVLYAAAFPPVALFPLAWIALAPLLVAVARVSPLRAAGLGALFAFGASLGLCWWLPGTVRDFFGVAPALAWTASLLVFAAFAAPHFAALGACLSWLARRGPVHPLVVAGAFGACEWARAHLLVANPWGLLGTSQLAWVPAAQSLDLVGVFGLGMAIAAVNGCVAVALTPGAPPLRRLRAAGLATALVALALGYGTWSLEQAYGDGAPTRVALVPGTAPRHERFAEAHRDRTLERHLALTARAAARAPDLVVWPEFAVDFLLRDDAPRRQRLARASRELGAEILLGAPDYSTTALGTHLFNSAFLLRDGRFVRRYDKVRLTPLSEASVLGGLGRDRYTPGSVTRPIESAAGALGVLLCVEALHPGYVRRVVASGARILVNPSNDDWFNHWAGRRQQLQNVAARAVESRRWLVRPSQGGETAAIDPHGRVRTLLPGDDVLFATVRPVSLATPYHRLGDLAPLLGAGLVMLCALFRVRWRFS